MLASLFRRETRSGGDFGWNDYIRLWESFGYNGSTYNVPSSAVSALTAMQGIRNPIVQAAIVFRMMTLSEIQFAYRPKLSNKGARELSWTDALDIFDAPYAGADPGDLVSRLELDASMYGNGYRYPSTSLANLGASGARKQWIWLDPQMMRILTGDAEGPSGAKAGKVLLMYELHDTAGKLVEKWLPGEIVHYKPIPDPEEPFRGMSWLSALLPDITADNDMTTYKHSFLTNAATPNLVVQFKNNIGPDAFNAFKERMEAAHTGPAQGFKTLYLGAGADVKVVGSNFADLNINENQGYGETRLSVASQVPAALLGIADGMKGSALNAGNYVAVRRRYADMLVRPTWKRMCGAVSVMAPPAPGKQLWYDERGIAFLTADLQDQAAVRTSDSTTIVNLTNAGYTPDSVKESVVTNDWNLLEHSGLMSVQLQPPVTEPPAPADDPLAAAATGGSDDGTSSS